MSKRRSWLRFSLRTVVVVFTIVTVILGVIVNRVHRQRKAVDHFLKLGGNISFTHDVDSKGQRITNPHPPGPKWLRDTIGADYFVSVYELNLRETKITDADLLPLSSLYGIRELNLFRTNVTTLNNVHQLNTLRRLDASETLVSDSEMRHLVRLPHLEYLDLNATRVTDQAATTLARCGSLRQVDVVGTDLTAKGVQTLLEAGKQVYCMLDLQIAAYDSSNKPLKVIKSDNSVCVRATYHVPAGATVNYRPLIFHIVGEVPNRGDVIMQSGSPTPAQSAPGQYVAEMNLTVIGLKQAMPGRVELRSWKAIARRNVELEP